MINRKKAVSTVIATILMINTAIAMGVIYVFWANGLLGTYTSKALVYFMLLEDRRDEEITLEKVWFESTNNITLIVRNIGIKDLNITTIYVNGTAITQYNTTKTLPYKMYVGQRRAFSVTYTWATGSIYPIIVATSRGNQGKGEWVAP